MRYTSYEEPRKIALELTSILFEHIKLHKKKLPLDLKNKLTDVLESAEFELIEEKNSYLIKNKRTNQIITSLTLTFS